MRLELTINMGNDAFRPSQSTEVRRIFKELADRTISSHVIHDSNGNVCGELKLIAEQLICENCRTCACDSCWGGHCGCCGHDKRIKTEIPRLVL